MEDLEAYQVPLQTDKFVAVDRRFRRRNDALFKRTVVKSELGFISESLPQLPEDELGESFDNHD
jgi:hypothetical protein